MAYNESIDILDIDEVLKDDSFITLADKTHDDISNILQQWKINDSVAQLAARQKIQQAEQAYKSNSRTFTRPKRKSAQNLESRFPDSCSNDLNQLSRNLKVMSMTQTLSAETGGGGGGGGGGNGYVGTTNFTNNDLITKSLLQDTSPPLSIISTEMSMEYMGDSLITSADFSDSKLTRSTQKLIGMSADSNILSHLQSNMNKNMNTNASANTENEDRIFTKRMETISGGMWHEDIQHGRQTPAIETVDPCFEEDEDFGISKDSQISQIDDISLTLNKNSFSSSAMNNSMDLLEDTSDIYNMNFMNYSGTADTNVLPELADDGQSDKVRRRNAMLQETMVLTDDLITNTTFDLVESNFSSVNYCGDETHAVAVADADVAGADADADADADRDANADNEKVNVLTAEAQERDQNHVRDHDHDHDHDHDRDSDQNDDDGRGRGGRTLNSESYIKMDATFFKKLDNGAATPGNPNVTIVVTDTVETANETYNCVPQLNKTLDGVDKSALLMRFSTPYKEKLYHKRLVTPLVQEICEAEELSPIATSKPIGAMPSSSTSSSSSSSTTTNNCAWNVSETLRPSHTTKESTLQETKLTPKSKSDSAFADDVKQQLSNDEKNYLNANGKEIENYDIQAILNLTETTAKAEAEEKADFHQDYENYDDTENAFEHMLEKIASFPVNAEQEKMERILKTIKRQFNCFSKTNNNNKNHNGLLRTDTFRKTSGSSCGGDVEGDGAGDGGTDGQDQEHDPSGKPRSLNAAANSTEAATTTENHVDVVEEKQRYAVKQAPPSSHPVVGYVKSERLLSRRNRLCDDIILPATPDSNGKIQSVKSHLHDNSMSAKGQELSSPAASKEPSPPIHSAEMDNNKAMDSDDHSLMRSSPNGVVEKLQRTQNNCAATVPVKAEAPARVGRQTRRSMLAERNDQNDDCKPDCNRFKTMKITRKHTDIQHAIELNVPCIDDTSYDAQEDAAITMNTTNLRSGGDRDASGDNNSDAVMAAKPDLATRYRLQSGFYKNPGHSNSASSRLKANTNTNTNTFANSRSNSNSSSQSNSNSNLNAFDGDADGFIFKKPSNVPAPSKINSRFSTFKKVKGKTDAASTIPTNLTNETTRSSSCSGASSSSISSSGSCSNSSTTRATNETLQPRIPMRGYYQARLEKGNTILKATSSGELEKMTPAAADKSKLLKAKGSQLGGNDANDESNEGGAKAKNSLGSKARSLHNLSSNFGFGVYSTASGASSSQRSNIASNFGLRKNNSGGLQAELQKHGLLDKMANAKQGMEKNPNETKRTEAAPMATGNAAVAPKTAMSAPIQKKRSNLPRPSSYVKR